MELGLCTLHATLLCCAPYITHVQGSITTFATVINWNRLYGAPALNVDTVSQLPVVASLTGSNIRNTGQHSVTLGVLFAQRSPSPEAWCGLWLNCMLCSSPVVPHSQHTCLVLAVWACRHLTRVACLEYGRRWHSELQPGCLCCPACVYAHKHHTKVLSFPAGDPACLQTLHHQWSNGD